MTTLITGGIGWVPSNITRAIAATGEQVVTYDLMEPDDMFDELLGELRANVTSFAGDITNVEQLLKSALDMASRRSFTPRRSRPGAIARCGSRPESSMSISADGQRARCSPGRCPISGDSSTSPPARRSVRPRTPRSSTDDAIARDQPLRHHQAHIRAGRQPLPGTVRSRRRFGPAGQCLRADGADYARLCRRD